MAQTQTLTVKRPFVTGEALFNALEPALNKDRFLVEEIDSITRKLKLVFDFKVYNKRGEPQKHLATWPAHVRARHRLKIEFNRVAASMTLPYKRRKQLIVAHDNDFNIKSDRGVGRINGLWLVKNIAVAAENKSALLPRYAKNFGDTKQVQVSNLVEANSDAGRALSDDRQRILMLRDKRTQKANGEITHTSLALDHKNRSDKW